MLAIIDAYHAQLLRFKNILPNIISGLIVGVVALPLSMAFAIASGVRPEQGLYTAIIAGIAVALFGGSRVQIAGPTGAFIVILANITAKYGVTGLQIASLLAGFILIFMGVVKLGNVIKYIPDPVIVGFTAGIGFIIFVGEWKDFFGLSIALPINAHFHEKLWLYLKHLSFLDKTTTLMALFSLFLIIVSPKFLKRIPGPLVAMLVVTFLQVFFQFKTVATIGSTFGAIPSQLPPFHLPSFGINELLDLIGPAFSIALLGAIESLLSAVAADGMIKTRHDANQELIGQGIANIASPLFGGFAATGAIARTATNIRNGGNSPISGIVHSLILLLILILLAPLAAYIPLCTLAAILFVVAYNMSDLPHFIHILKKAPYYDVLILIMTFLLTIFTNLILAVNVGVILAMLFFIRNMQQSVQIEEQTHTLLENELLANGLKSLPHDTLVYTIQGPFFFGAAEKIERAFAAIHIDPKVIVFRLYAVPFIDMTGLATFQELIEAYYKRGVGIHLCEVNSRVAKQIKQMEILKYLKAKKLFHSFSEVLKVI